MKKPPVSETVALSRQLIQSRPRVFQDALPITRCFRFQHLLIDTLGIEHDRSRVRSWRKLMFEASRLLSSAERKIFRPPIDALDILPCYLSLLSEFLCSVNCFYVFFALQA